MPLFEGLGQLLDTARTGLLFAALVYVIALAIALIAVLLRDLTWSSNPRNPDDLF